jgi:Flp pilus assembly protein TadD
MEQDALALFRNGRLAEAAELFAIIVREQPDWEHGTAFYDLACCYEGLSELAAAEEHYRNALRYEPGNPIFLGGLASFLDLHGDPHKAFEAYLGLLSVEQLNKDRRGIHATLAALHSLGSRMGLSEEDVAKRVQLVGRR